MRLVAFLFLFANHLSSIGQAFDLEKEWLGAEGFFEQEFVKRNAIRKINVSKSVKKDLQFFQEEKPYLQFTYNKNGQLEKSFKFIQMSYGIDTALIENSYNSSNQVYKKRLQQGSFLFDYFYFFENGEMVTELKLDVKSSPRDTSYLRNYSYSSAPSKLIQTVYNSNGSPFMYWSTELDEKNRLIRKRNYFHRNQNFTELIYSYEDEKISEKEKIEFFVEKNVFLNKYDYIGGKLETISHLNNDEVLEKYSITYDKNHLPSAIIQREVEEKSISIFRISYLIEVD